MARYLTGDTALSEAVMTQFIDELMLQELLAYMMN